MGPGWGQLEQRPEGGCRGPYGWTVGNGLGQIDKSTRKMGPSLSAGPSAGDSFCPEEQVVPSLTWQREPPDHLAVYEVGSHLSWLHCSHLGP